MIAYTARSWKALSDFSELFRNDEHCSVFPEHANSPLELKSFVKDNRDKYREVITFNAHLLSDADEVHVIDMPKVLIKRGESSNLISMKVWGPETIGLSVYTEIENLKLKVENGAVSVEDALRLAYQFGDSIERSILVSYVLSLENNLADSEKRKGAY